jgi:hypothetical protein
MTDINLPDVLAEMQAVFDQYEDALVHNKVDVLDALFWNSPHTVRYGTGENLVGYAEIQAFRLARSLSRTVISTFGRDFATAMTEFHRDGNPAIGRQSQTWVRMAGGWKVVAAHVSLLAPT